METLESQAVNFARHLDSFSAAERLHQIDADLHTHIVALELAMHVFELWRPRVDNSKLPVVAASLTDSKVASLRAYRHARGLC